jgi:hypothetical protein
MGEFFYKLFQKAPMLPNRQALNIFEDEVGGPQLGDNTDEISYETISRVIQRPMTDHRKPLAWRAPKYNFHALTPNPCLTPNLVSGQTCNRPRQHCALGKVVLVNRAMDRVDLNGGHNIKACLLEAQS